MIVLKKYPPSAGSLRFRLAVAQSVSLTGDVAANLAEAAALCAQARDAGADLIVFPEAHASGYSYRDVRALVEWTAEPLEGRIGRRLQEMARENGIVVCCGMFERAAGRVFNTHAVAFPDGRLEGQRKGVASPAERGILALEPVRRAFSWRGVRFGILVCADNALPAAEREFARLGISLLLHPCAGRILRVGTEAERDLRREADGAFQSGLRMAKRLGLHYAAANPIGFSGEDFYPGNSWIILSRGTSFRMPATANPSAMRSSVIVKPLSDLPARL